MSNPAEHRRNLTGTLGVGGADFHPHALRSVEVLKILETDRRHGLNEKEVEDRRRQWGRNQLEQSAECSWWKRLFAQFADLVVGILIVAAIVSAMLGEWVEALAILVIVLMNGMIGYFQEERASQALAALEKFSAPLAKVIRSGALINLPVDEVVPGDIIEIQAGDSVPADARLFSTYNLTIQEAALTGESVPSEKVADAMLAQETPLGDRGNMVYMGTIAAAGKGQAVVVATGMQTELGQIADLLKQPVLEVTPLQRRLSELGRVLIVICLSLVGIIFVLHLLRGDDLFAALLMSVSLAVAAVPEGLPAVVTLALALGLQRMVKRNALIRKLPSVETLGSVTVICSDKTGTLTRNEMTVQEILAGGERFRVSGVGYQPIGEFSRASSSRGGEGEPVVVDQMPVLKKLLRIGAACNDARLQPAADSAGSWQILGDPTEGALVVAAMKGGIDAAEEHHQVIFEIPFNSDRKTMSVVVDDSAGMRQLLCKGAPEVLLQKCLAELTPAGVVPLTPQRRQEIQSENVRMARQALRVLACAVRDDVPAEALPAHELERNLVFVGLVGMIDPPREEARAAVARCWQAGIRPVMITGDHQATALAIAEKLGMARPGSRAVSGEDLERLSDQELIDVLPQTAVFARATAEHKLRIVQAWKARGEIVAMTGDGVNDAPAVRAADIGIAMGITGTDVTKEAADMTLLDDNFASIINAVEEGRGIFDNIQKVLQYLLSCNLGEILVMLVSSLLGWPIPLLPVQLLWINLVTDGLPGLALSLEPPEPGQMQRPPRPPHESILSRRIGVGIAIQGSLLAFTALLGFGTALFVFAFSPERARSLTFCVIVYAELFRAFAARSQTMTFWQLGPLTNPGLLLAVVASGVLQLSVTMLPFTQEAFELPAHSLAEWGFILSLALIPVTFLELRKLWLSFFGTHNLKGQSRDES